MQLDATKYHSMIVAFSIMRPEHHTKDPALFDELNSAAGKGASAADLLLLAKKTLKDGQAKGEFIAFISNLAAGLPKLRDILDNPATAKVPSAPNFQYVVASAIAKAVRNKEEAAQYAIYLARLEPDIASIAAHDIAHNDPEVCIPALQALRKFEDK